MTHKGRLIKRIVTIGAVVLLLGALSFYVLYNKDKNSIPDGFIMGNGRLEATEVDIATKIPGRLIEVLVKEGDYVDKNQIVARMDTSALQAQLNQAEVRRLIQTRHTAISKVEGIRLKVELAGKELKRSKNLFTKGIVTQQQYD